MNFKRMTDLDLAGKRVLIREDLNVPVKDGKVTSDARIRASLPTIEHALKAGAKVMLMSHVGLIVTSTGLTAIGHYNSNSDRHGSDSDWYVGLTVTSV